MSGPQFSWYVRRLRRMSATEVLHRAGDAGRRRAWARRQVEPGASPPLPRGVAAERTFGSPLPATARAQVPPMAAATLVRAAERVLDGTWTVFGTARPDSADPDWFYDPLTGRRAPERELAFRIHHRDEAETGNIKQVWEMSRHHHVTVLAAAWWLTQDERYAEAAASQLRSWWRANPYLTGVHWTSGIEVGIRLISWVWIRRLLDDWPKAADLFEHNDDAVRQIAWHQEFLAAFPSRGSSANNHVVAEAAGQLAAACAFPWYGRTRKWRRSAAVLLERELAANTFDDGLNRELATDYHRFVLELGLLAAVEADVAGYELSDATWQCLTRMLDAGAAILDTTGRAPRQGDGDEGRALIVDHPDDDPWALALATGSALLGAPAWWPGFDGGVQACLVGALGRTRQLDRPADRPRRFPDAGQVFLRSRAEDGPEIWCRCDGGPHGFLSIAAHAHADALSVELRHDGVDILADPGTYCYHGEPEWREWFRSTAAHNTVEIAGVSQAESGGPFLWTTQPRTRTTTCDVGEQAVQVWTAEHDGYRRLKNRTVHRRSVTLDSPNRILTVVDTFDTAGKVALLLSWHLGPGVLVELDGAVATLTWQVGRQRRQATLELPAGLVWSAHTGETDPALGWYSPRFGRRVPATTLVGRGTGSSATRLETTLTLP
ncbi:MAG TPA: alginate lyase family protein [Jatrophihabitans sp.]|nr:alginate lyase family protein [Jatrophihabitans sp.]